MEPGAHAQILQMAGNVLTPRTTFNSRVRASRVGEFILPPFQVNVYGKPVTIPGARLVVVSSASPGIPAAQRLLLDLPATNLFAGQSVRARVILPGSERGVVLGLNQVQLTGQGFLVDQASARPRIEAISRAGVSTVAFIYELVVTPIATGKLPLYAQAFSSGGGFSGPIVMAGPQYTLLDSEPIDIRVRPLPREGQLPGFTGGIGSFTLDPPQLATNTVKVGEPVKLTVTVHGDAGLARLVPPPAPRSVDWQVFGTSDHAPLPPRAPPAQSVAFSFTLIALSPQAHATPAIPFCYFDPKRPGYEDLTIPPIPVTVLPGPIPADLQALRQSEHLAAESEKEPVLSGLAASPGRSVASLVPVQKQGWFALLQLVPATLLLGLAGWDRRRRYLQEHPEVVRCRRARRALRREWRVARQAARAGDAPRFASAAVSAMRVACAPHYPAEPRALVGQDILEVLPEAIRSTRLTQVVRRFFNVTDANRFAPGPVDPSELIGLEPELDQLLQQLEAKLCA